MQYIILFVLLNGTPQWPEDDSHRFESLRQCEVHGEHALNTRADIKGYVCIARAPLHTRDDT